MSESNPPSGGMPDPMQYWRDFFQDPTRLWREFYQQAESAWGPQLEQGMGSEAYAAMIGQTLEAYVGLHKALRESMNRYLETMNLPSRDDFARVASQITALEAKIDGLDEKVEDLQDKLLDGDRTPNGQPTSRPANRRQRWVRSAGKRH
jgi:polyhydroxyalkanoic acid synthase PhaR subunit